MIDLEFLIVFETQKDWQLIDLNKIIKNKDFFIFWFFETL